MLIRLPTILLLRTENVVAEVANLVVVAAEIVVVDADVVVVAAYFLIDLSNVLERSNNGGCVYFEILHPKS